LNAASVVVHSFPFSATTVAVHSDWRALGSWPQHATSASHSALPKAASLPASLPASIAWKLPVAKQ
jgi:hypothetical protein